MLECDFVTPGKPDSFEAMLFFVPLAVKHKTPTADQFIGQPPGQIERLVLVEQLYEPLFVGES